MKRKREGEETETAASTSSSQDDGSGRGYEVFLSFRGPDTRLTIVDTLYNHLIRAGIHTFKDDKELRFGEKIEGSLLQAIKDSRIYIPIFSKCYASSKWCLRELKLIVELSQDNDEKVILPIFYDVDVDDVKLKTKLYQKALQKHHSKSGEDLPKWEKALKEVTRITGKKLIDHGLDKLNSLIVEEVSSHLWTRRIDVPHHLVGIENPKDKIMAMLDLGSFDVRRIVIHGMGGIGKTTLADAIFSLYELVNLVVGEVSILLCTRCMDVPENLVGIEGRMDKIMQLLDLGASDVRLIVIHGMGGIGKTTLAEAVFRRISPQFQGDCCFLRDVRADDILNLQKKLSSEILHHRWTNLSCVNEGANMIQERFNRKKVFIVLDDVDKLDQIERLADNEHWFGEGSRIIITTRNIDFLVSETEDHNTSRYQKASFYEMPEMDPNDALELFSKNAFKSAKPPLDYMNISRELIYALGRLPLALKVIGSTLCGKSRITWEDSLKRLQKVMNKDVKERLMISYDALESWQQKIYLDIACFFIHEEKAIAVKYWDSIYEYPTRNDVKILTNMSLIKITCDDKLGMHDQLRDLGRNIVDINSGNDQSGSRYWSPKDAIRVVQSKKGTEKVVGLNLGTPEPDVTYRFKHEEFSRLFNLRFLQLDHGNFEGDFKNLFFELRWLSWSNCPLEFGATNFGLVNLVVLKLCRSNITEDWGGWSQIMVAKQLKVLILINCPALRETPNFSSISRLERLILRGCNRLEKIDESIGNLQHLDHLEIESATIESLPKSIGSLKSLTELRVTSKRLLMLPDSIVDLGKLKHLILICKELRKLPDSIGQLDSLLELHVRCSRIGELPYSIGNLERLRILEIYNSDLERLPDSIGSLKSLVKLHVDRSRVKTLPDSIGDLKKLKVLFMSGGDISELPKSIGMLENLEKLHVCNLEGEIPSEIGALSSLKIIRLYNGRFKGLPTTINQLTNLQQLELRSCRSIQQLPELPESLTELSVSWDSLTTIPDFSNLSHLVSLEVGGDPALLEEPRIEGLERLRTLRVLDLDAGKGALAPTDLSSLSRLQRLSISYGDSRSLIGLPSSLRYLRLMNVRSPIDWSLFSNLENLSSLSISGYLPGEIRFEVLEKLRKFNTLYMDNCPSLKTLPVLPCLKEIRSFYLEDLPQLTQIQGLGELKSLRDLTIHRCNSIRSLDESDLSNLQNLKSLEFFSCESLERVRDLSSLSQLQRLSISYGDSLSLIGLPSSLKYLSLRDVRSPIDWSLFSNLENLSELCIQNYLPGEIRFEVLGKLRKFKELRMAHCPSLKTLPVLPCLKEIQSFHLEDLPQLTQIQGLGELKSLWRFCIHRCNSMKSLDESDLSNLQNLKWLEISRCKSLERVPVVPKSCELRVWDCPRFNSDG